MREAAATKAKNHFGQILDTAMTEPVTIEKKGRPVAVLLSFAEYQRLVELEDRYWGQKAQDALKEGLLTEKKTTKWLKRKLSAETSGK